MTRRMYRYEVPVDDQPHALDLTGEIVRVELRWPDGDVHAVEFWAEHNDHRAPATRVFQVYGTGHPLPARAQWRGTAGRTVLGLVWHLYELFPNGQAAT